MFHSEAANSSGHIMSIAGSSIYIAPGKLLNTKSSQLFLLRKVLMDSFFSEVYSLKYSHKCDVYSFGLILW